MFEKDNLSPKNCSDCCSWLGVKNNYGICGVSERSTFTSGDHIGCEDQLSAIMVRKCSGNPDLIKRIDQFVAEKERKEINKILERKNLVL